MFVFRRGRAERVVGGVGTSPDVRRPTLPHPLAGLSQWAASWRPATGPATARRPGLVRCRVLATDEGPRTRRRAPASQRDGRPSTHCSVTLATLQQARQLVLFWVKTRESTESVTL